MGGREGADLGGERVDEEFVVVLEQEVTMREERVVGHGEREEWSVQIPVGHVDLLLEAEEVVLVDGCHRYCMYYKQLRYKWKGVGHKSNPPMIIIYY